MEDQVYETDSLNEGQLESFIDWFEAMIGTEYEVNDADDENEFYVMCFDLSHEEVKMVRDFENNSL